MTESKNSKKKFFQTWKGITVILAVMIAAVICAAVYFKWIKKGKPSSEYLVSTLVKSDELTSAKLNYKGMTHYQDSGVKIFNRSDFYIIYEATVRIGINLSDAKVTVDDAAKVVHCQLPKAGIQEVKVDENTIEFHDVGFALFNFDGRDDTAKAVGIAENDAKDQFTDMGVLEFADTSAQETVKGLLTNAIPADYKLDVTTAEE